MQPQCSILRLLSFVSLKACLEGRMDADDIILQSDVKNILASVEREIFVGVFAESSRQIQNGIYSGGHYL
jgi:hypothetical protein